MKACFIFRHACVDERSPCARWRGSMFDLQLGDLASRACTRDAYQRDKRFDRALGNDMGVELESCGRVGSEAERYGLVYAMNSGAGQT
jgi:hypothetical protein